MDMVKEDRRRRAEEKQIAAEAHEARRVGRDVRRVLNDDGTTTLRLLHPSRLHAVEPAIAITIHRSQGSEANRVIVLWPPSQDSERERPLENRLLYTAITRARASLDVITTTTISDAS